MKLTPKAMSKIRLLENEYGQLSNVPSTHPYIEKLSKYGKPTPPKKLDTIAYFYLSTEELNKITCIMKEKKKVRTTGVRELIIDYLENPTDLDKDEEIKREERFTLYVYKEDFEKIVELANEYKVLHHVLLSMVIKKYLKCYKQGVLYGN